MNFPSLSEIERGYLAGLIDGEGAICVHKLTTQYMTKLYIFNNNEELLYWVQEKVGGIVRLHQGNTFRWEVGRKKDILRILNQVFDVLIVKKELARVMIELCELRLNHLQERLSERERVLFEKIRELNGKRRKTR